MNKLTGYTGVDPLEQVYLIGGNGFIGKHLAAGLMSQYRVTVFDRFIDIDYFNKMPKINTCRIDVGTENIPDDYHSAEFVINLASTITTASRDLADLDNLAAENIRILLNLFKHFRNDQEVRLFMQFGSVEEYGNGPSPFREDQRETPNSVYAVIKQLTSNSAIMLNRNFGFPSMVVRPGNLFGPWQNDNRFIPYVVQKLVRNEELEVTLCEQKRDFLYISDFVDVIKKILIKWESFPGEVVNISSGIGYRLNEVIEHVKKSLDSSSLVSFGKIPYRENEAMDQVGNIKKLERLIGEELHFNSMDRLDQYSDEAAHSRMELKKDNKDQQILA